MTYCVGMMIDGGTLFMSDTRTNAGLDNISTFRKMRHWEAKGDRVITLMSAGNLATTQAVVSVLDERTKAHDEREPSLMGVPSMFQAARLIADTLRNVIANHNDAGQTASASFNATLIVGGQIKGGPQRLFLIYPEGNFIEACDDTPFFQIGEMKYGRPILVRAYDPAMTFEKAMRLMLVSFDSTLKANLTVGAPFDYHFYRKDSLCLGPSGRIELDDPRFMSISTGWGDALKSALESLPDFDADPE
ncbi:peptidase [Ponticoccus sp. SC2-23]|uniref:peptidase n=1 Tax=Alexandriicola marinus TaxID=2081710 RepID=UPI00193B36EB|nr:peptidase [Alexandriicola marinus]MBM1221102.1 peptidase [Ponticoccus sp. SC6-9]MBM1225672.1 peptidase [Ponticoccus sp. SC6-15]MBM1227824.1 peptidase [Ponticoccus sp. SC6-38]MBM1234538.1 peptidase [Ponticoccus sp. SC6-45]MBM1238326.1 peptidase [Ponticoccus sp. SC6-49]MBM1243595.1 peptidase [Ponticoccus sp. SC2-64]MBM1248062.1 peptidase [Ponticoccus sp. SC6-42]MBM1252726.1 peptidase [Ponticoccus sp. SC6-33]MBM1256335.1 peptidase [Ponticoccus sp. SC6-60]MBM1261620.1 peptidase [Ponticoccu